MKKKIFLAMALCTLLLTSFAPALANFEPVTASQDTVLYQVEEITDKNVLLERATQNLHEAPDAMIQSALKNVTLNDIPLNSNDFRSTSQLLTVKSTRSNNVVSEYAVNVMVDIELAEYGQLRAADYSKTEHETEPGGEATLYATIYYEAGYVGNVPYRKMTGVMGEYKILHGLTSYSNGRVKYGWQGINLDTMRASNIESGWISKPSGSKYTVGGLKLETSIGAYAEIFGGVGCTLTRGSSVWDAEFKVYQVSGPFS